MRKLSRQDIAKIRSLKEKGIGRQMIAVRFGISPVTVDHYTQGRSRKKKADFAAPWLSEENVVAEFGHEFSREHYLCDLDRVQHGTMTVKSCKKKWSGVVEVSRLNSDLLSACRIPGERL